MLFVGIFMRMEPFGATAPVHELEWAQFSEKLEVEA